MACPNQWRLRSSRRLAAIIAQNSAGILATLRRPPSRRNGEWQNRRRISSRKIMARAEIPIINHILIMHRRYKSISYRAAGKRSASGSNRRHKWRIRPLPEISSPATVLTRRRGIPTRSAEMRLASGAREFGVNRLGESVRADSLCTQRREIAPRIIGNVTKLNSAAGRAPGKTYLSRWQARSSKERHRQSSER